jgi:Glycosyl transferases group 1.
VVSNFFGANDIIKNNENGIILEKNCFEDLVLSVEKILNNKEFANKLRKNIFETKIISEDEEFDKINEIYNLYK